MFINQYVNRQLQNHILDSIEGIAIESSLNINSTIKNKFSLLKTVAHNISEKDLDNIEEIVKSFSNIVRENRFKRMAITTMDGTAYCDNGSIINVSDKESFKTSINGEDFISSIFKSILDGRRTNVFSVPIYNDENNEVIAVLWASLFNYEFYQEFNIKKMNELGENFIINSNGNIIAFNESVTLKYDSYNLFDELNLKNKDKILESIKEDLKILDKGCKRIKNDCIIYYTRLDYNDWWVVSLITDNSIKEYYYSVIKTVAIVNIIIILPISIALITIINREREVNKNLKALVYTDNITGGKNDIYIKNNLNKIINNKSNFAFICLEITNIKDIVTIIGLRNCEFILTEVYDYLSNILSKDEIVIHNYFGEYKIIMKYENVKDLIKRIGNIDFSKINETIKFIMGIYLVEHEDVSYEEMCSYTSIAKQSIKNIGKNNIKYMVYNKQMHNREINKRILKEDIKRGIENKEFKAWFQPKYGKDGKTIIGAEALVRWHKYGSIISPYIFIPICEANGLIKEIDELILEDVCKNLREWIDNNKKVVPISINLSRSYLDKLNFIEVLKKYVNEYRIPNNLICFEITESSLIENEEKLKNTVSILHKEGFEVLVDDFGVGYSSVKAISYVNFDILKIDKSFIDGIGEEKWENIIKYTINLSNSLGMAVIAEGIETEEQYKFLLECNCDMFQGYYFNKPMDSEDFSKLI